MRNTAHYPPKRAELDAVLTALSNCQKVFSAQGYVDLPDVTTALEHLGACRFRQRQFPRLFRPAVFVNKCQRRGIRVLQPIHDRHLAPGERERTCGQINVLPVALYVEITEGSRFRREFDRAQQPGSKCTAPSRTRTPSSPKRVSTSSLTCPVIPGCCAPACFGVCE